MSDKTVVVTSDTVKVATIGIQGPQGPNAIYGKNFATGTVTANGTLLNYDSTADLWVSTLEPTGLTIGGGNF